MSGLKARLRSLWRGLTLGGRVDAEMDEEFRLHMDLRAEDLVRAGLLPREAARQARLEFGAPERYREEGRAARGLERFDEVRTDLRHAARALGRSPGLAAVAVLMLALGVGANAAVFSLVSANLLRPLPFADPERLVVLHQTHAPQAGESWPVPWSYPEYEAVRHALSGFSHLAAYTETSVNVAAQGEVFRASAEFVSPEYLRALAVQPTHGRDFLPEDAAAVVIVSHDVWQQQLGGLTGTMPGVLHVNGLPFTVIGVAPPGFRGLTGAADAWLLHAAAPAIYLDDYVTSDQRFLHLVGRVTPGGSVAQVRAAVATAGLNAADAVRATMPGSAWPGEWGADVVALDAARRDPATVRAQLVLSGAVLFVLLIAVVNVFALLLARSAVRARETAVRGALGAGRGRLVRHAAVEGAVLGVAGGVLGIVLALWSVRLLATLAPERLGVSRSAPADLGSFATPTLDWRVLAFTVLLSVGAGVLAGVLPALQATRGDFVQGVRSGARGTSMSVGSLRRPTTLSLAAITQVACALVLLVAAGVLLQAFQRLAAVDPGFNAAGVVTFRVSPPVTMYGSDAAAPLLERILQQVEAVPGVQSATVSLCTPHTQCSTTSLFIDGDVDATPTTVGRHYVAPEHFTTLGIPLLRGRALTDADRPGQPLVAVINETAARRLWPGEDPIGRRVRFSSGGPFASPDALTEIVGVVGDVLYGRPGDAVRPDFYTAYHQFTWPYTTVMARAAGDPLALAPALRQAVLEVDPHLPIHDVRTMADRSAQALAGERFAVAAVTIFALLGLLLATLGVYGIMAYSVAQRRREIGIRLALGLPPRHVLRTLLAHGAALTATGLLAGAALSLWLGQALPALVAGMEGVRPAVLLAVALPLAVVSLVACWLPARAAMSVDPRETLAAE